MPRTAAGLDWANAKKKVPVLMLWRWKSHGQNFKKNQLIQDKQQYFSYLDRFSVFVFYFTAEDIFHKIPSHNIHQISGILYIWLVLAGWQQDSRGNNFTLTKKKKKWSNEWIKYLWHYLETTVTFHQIQTYMCHAFSLSFRNGIPQFSSTPKK